MPITEQAIENFELDYVCDTCGIGNMRPEGACWMSSPPQFPHRCNNPECKAEQVFSDVRYPTTAYRRTGEPKPHRG